jgi:actin related protein 2/3 complex subunit 1A/1B
MSEHREESALHMFRQMDLKGKVKDDTQLKTIHQNTITVIRAYEESGGRVKKFSSACPPPPFFRIPMTWAY